MLFPNAMSINTREELEEERRLFYVVITRAKKRLWITYAGQRYKFGSLVQNEPSRFINELPEQFLDRSFAGGGVRNQGSGGFQARSAYERMNSGARNAAPERPSSTPSYLAPKQAPKTVEHDVDLESADCG